MRSLLEAIEAIDYQTVKSKFNKKYSDKFICGTLPRKLLVLDRLATLSQEVQTFFSSKYESTKHFFINVTRIVQILILYAVGGVPL